MPANDANRLLLVSADCHAGAPVETYRAYMDPDFRDDYEGYLLARVEIARARRQLREELFSADVTETFVSDESVTVGLTGAWDPDVRLRELEREGIVTEVIFPDLQNENEPPFGAFTGGPGSTALQRMAGARAYNRWLSELCQGNPDRHVGLGLIVPHDVDAAVEEVRRIHAEGMRGVILPTAEPGLPLYNHPRYERLWATCADLHMPLHTHSGAHQDYGSGPEATLLYGTESMWFNRRPFWLLLWAGVFERYPNLNFIVTEQGADWIPQMLNHLDEQYKSPLHRGVRTRLALAPSEYWKRQCYVGATFITKPECELRYQIGVNTILWGSDYPHLEGTWPHSWELMKENFSATPEAEVRDMIGRTSLDVYRLNGECLYELASKFGPQRSNIITDNVNMPQEDQEPVALSANDQDGNVFIREVARRVYGRSSEEV